MNGKNNNINKCLTVFITPDQAVQLEWEETKAILNKRTLDLQNDIYTRYTSKDSHWLLFLGLCNRNIKLLASLDYLRLISYLFIQKLRKTPDLEVLRENVEVLLSNEEYLTLMNAVPIMAGAEYINNDFIGKLWEQLNVSFSKEIKKFNGSVGSFFQTFRSDIHLAGRVYFHLVENKGDQAPFAFLATYSTRLDSQGLSRHLPLKHALVEYNDEQDKLLELLSTVYRASEQSELIKDMIDNGELFHPLAWTSKDAYIFLNEIPIYEESGILCRIPDWWKGKGSSPKLNFNLGDKKPSLLGMDAILSLSSAILIDGMQISHAEAKKLLEESEGLAFLKNKWVPVDHEKLKKVLDAYEKAEELMGQGFSIREALQLQMNPGKLSFIDDIDEDDFSISNGQWLASVFEKLQNPDLTSNVKLKPDFKAELRPYQHQGVNWLHYLDSLSFGACLADDMGLGKTIQLLGFLNAIIQNKINNSSLLILPASLITNWISEIKKFYPELNYYIAHPDFRSPKKSKKDNKSKKNESKKNESNRDNMELKSDELDKLDLVITTYALSHRYEWIQDYSWRYVILDEAQAIKNPNTKQSRNIKKIPCKNRIVMTGTPIENRLGDLWSLFDFLNPGLLGNKREFSDFSKSLKNDSSGYQRLRKVISPYILRRLKTDKSIISDLPDKVEVKVFASLSKKQIVLYQKIISDIQAFIENSEGIKRKGLILAALTKFKQLCNHPDQYLGTGTFEEKHSGKFSRLRELCETIYEKREKLLVFTQFKEMTKPLAIFLSSIFKRDGLILHGSVPVKKRKERIDQFQSDRYIPFMVLSLKAGGTGLNLTRANHVIHFDRWWNPAVENQATDRAFRIGQKKNVMVHKFITRGSIEEKIDQMLEEKKQLSNDVIQSTGEAWITEMNNDEIMELFNLSIY